MLTFTYNFHSPVVAYTSDQTTMLSSSKWIVHFSYLKSINAFFMTIKRLITYMNKGPFLEEKTLKQFYTKI
uniref:Putative ovule protein n=1 Tax=Solanum chacoense TaxID=4108 RepID=A0A0V0HG68_SOLCH